MSDEEGLLRAALDAREVEEQNSENDDRLAQDTQAATGSHLSRPPIPGEDASPRPRDLSPMPFVTYLCDKKNMPSHWCCKVFSTFLTVATFAMISILVLWIVYVRGQGPGPGVIPGDQGNHSSIQTTPTTGCCPVAYGNQGNHAHNKGDNLSTDDVILGRWARQVGLNNNDTSVAYSVITTGPDTDNETSLSVLDDVTDPPLDNSTDPSTTSSSSSSSSSNTTATTPESNTEAEVRRHQILSMVLPVVGSLCLVAVLICVIKVVVCSGIYAHCEPEESLCHRALSWCDKGCCSQHKLWTLEEAPQHPQEDHQQYEVRLNNLGYHEMI